MKKFLSILFILGILCSCDMADNSNENDENNQSEKNQQTISQDKLEICPRANETAWVIDYAQEMFAQVGLGDKRIEEITEKYWAKTGEPIEVKLRANFGWGDGCKTIYSLSDKWRGNDFKVSYDVFVPTINN